jgi:hypothetical protein
VFATRCVAVYGVANPSMPTTIKTILEFALLALTSIFFLVDPFAVISRSPPAAKKPSAMPSPENPR